MKSAQEIKAIMDENWFEHFGLRADRKGIEAGTVLDNSHQWYQDYIWGDLPDPKDYNSDPEHPFNAELGFWDDGELPGVSTIGIEDKSIDGIERALKLVDSYYYSGMAVYLIGGDGHMEGGNDIGEWIIEDGTCICAID